MRAQHTSSTVLDSTADPDSLGGGALTATHSPPGAPGQVAGLEIDSAGALEHIDDVAVMRPRSNRAATFMLCAKKAYKDWLLFAVLLAILPVTEKWTTAREMYITEPMLDHIKFPFLRSTVPSWSVPIYSFLTPSVVIGVHGQLTGQAAATMHGGILGALTSTVLAADITNFFKVQVGRPRPNFFYRCFPDGHEEWTDGDIDGQRHPVCHPRIALDVVDGYKSFPSGHTSWSFGSLFFLSLYLSVFLCPSGRPESSVALVTVLAPSVFAAWVGATRVIDYYHNASDVLAGGLIGIVFAGLVFLAHMPAELLRKAEDSGGLDRAAESQRRSQGALADSAAARFRTPQSSGSLLPL